MKSYKLVGCEFVEVPDPTFDSEISDVDESIFKAGYRAEISSKLENSIGADVVLYSTDNADKPRFYIDIMGQNTGIASLVADDFPHLARTLKEIQPLISLVGLDQQACGQLADQ